MRQISVVVVLVLASLLSSCEIPLQSQSPGSLTISLPTDARAAPSKFEYVTQWIISGTGPDGATFSQTADLVANKITVSGLSVGTWTINLKARDSSYLLFEGNATIELHEGTNSLSITMINNAA